MIKVFTFTVLLVLSMKREVKGHRTVKPMARDSYVKAAEHSTTLNGKDNLVYGDPSAFYYQLHPNPHNQHYEYGQNQISTAGGEYGVEYLNNLNMADAKQDPGSIGGILSLAYGTLSSLSWVSTGILFIILAPVLIPMVLSPIIFFGIILYFIPVIRLDLGSTEMGRRSGRVEEAVKHVEATARLVYQLTANEECLERVTCEVGRMARGVVLVNWIQSKLDGYENTFVKRLAHSLRIASRDSDCKSFTCDPKREFRRLMKSYGRKKVE